MNKRAEPSRFDTQLHLDRPRFACLPESSQPVPRADCRIAIVHDWCPAFRGGERVLARLCSLFPGAEVFTLFDFLPAEIKEEYFAGIDFHTSVASQLPWIRKFYRHLFFLYPMLIEQFDVTEHDAVVTSSAAFARGVLTRPDQPHFCYVHSPIRYAWDEQFTYLAQARLGYGLKRLIYRYMLHRARIWDVRTAHGPDVMVANSQYVRTRIRRIYGRDAQVIYPPVEVNEQDYREQKDDYYVAASFLAPYKRTDLVIRAFTAMPNRTHCSWRRSTDVSVAKPGRRQCYFHGLSAASRLCGDCRARKGDGLCRLRGLRNCPSRGAGLRHTSHRFSPRWR